MRASKPLKINLTFQWPQHHSCHMQMTGPSCLFLLIQDGKRDKTQTALS